MAFFTSHFHPANLALFAALLACVAFSRSKMSRRTSEPDGVVKDVYAVWELPMVFLLPGLYVLIVPAIRLTLSQWRVRKVPKGLHRGDDRHRLRLRSLCVYVGAPRRRPAP